MIFGVFGFHRSGGRWAPSDPSDYTERFTGPIHERLDLSRVQDLVGDPFGTWSVTTVET